MERCIKTGFNLVFSSEQHDAVVMVRGDLFEVGSMLAAHYNANSVTPVDHFSPDELETKCDVRVVSVGDYDRNGTVVFSPDSVVVSENMAQALERNGYDTSNLQRIGL
jgi:hypothetical protein